MSTWTRKIQRTGPGTQGINLPKSWVRHVELDIGDELRIVEKDEELNIQKED